MTTANTSIDAIDPPCAMCTSLSTDELVPIDQGPNHQGPQLHAHGDCAFAIHETYFSSEGTSILGFKNVDPRRRSLNCSVSKVEHGYMVQCTYGTCIAAAHFSCIKPYDGWNNIVALCTSTSSAQAAPPAESKWLYQDSVPRTEAAKLNGGKRPTKRARIEDDFVQVVLCPKHIPEVREALQAQREIRQAQENQELVRRLAQLRPG